MSTCAVSLQATARFFSAGARLENRLEKSFQPASQNGFPKPLARARRQASLRSQNRMRLGFSSLRSAERARIKWANNLAAFSPSAFGSPLFLFVEQPGEHALSGFLTHLRRGKCHTPFLSFEPINSGCLVVILDSVSCRVDS